MDFEKIKKFKNRPKTQKILKIAIILILLIAFVRGVIYATVFPLWQAPDEPVQFQYIDFYARKHLPFETNNEYKKSDNLIIEKVDEEILDSLYELKHWEFNLEKTSDWLKSGERLRKKIDKTNGVIYTNPPGYPIASLLFYTPVHSANVSVRAYAMRLFSIILAVLVVYLGYRTAKELFPDDLFIVLGTPLFITFVPAFTHMSSAINPDNLANFSTALFIFYSVKILKKLSWFNFFILLLSVFMGIYTKRTTFFTLTMLFLIPIFILILSKSNKLNNSYKRYGAIFTYFLIAFLGGLYLVPAVSNKLGFYGFNLSTATSTKDAIINYFRTTPIAEFVDKMKRLSRSFWASFAWGEVRINRLSYSILWNFTFIPLLGLFIIPLKRIFSKRSLFSKHQVTIITYLAILLITALSIVLIKQLIISKEDVPGRYIFTVMIVIAIFTTLGLSQLVKNKKILLLLTFSILFLFDASTLFIYIIPFFYKTPQTYNLSFLYLLANLFHKPFVLNSIYFYVFIFFTYFSLIGYLAYNLLLTNKIQGAKAGLESKG